MLYVFEAVIVIITYELCISKLILTIIFMHLSLYIHIEYILKDINTLLRCCARKATEILYQ